LAETAPPFTIELLIYWLLIYPNHMVYTDHKYGSRRMAFSPGTEAPQSGIYWCSVCKTPAQFKAGEQLPTCRNLCGRGRWEFVKAEDAGEPK
jgi:hypothetical protein